MVEKNPASREGHRRSCQNPLVRKTVNEAHRASADSTGLGYSVTVGGSGNLGMTLRVATGQIFSPLKIDGPKYGGHLHGSPASWCRAVER